MQSISDFHVVPGLNFVPLGKVETFRKSARFRLELDQAAASIVNQNTKRASGEELNR